MVSRAYPGAVSTEPDEPTRAIARPNPPLTSRQRWTAVAIAAGCVVGAGVVAALIGVVAGGGAVAGAGEVVWSAVVYGGLLASAAVVLYVDRAYALQCPRCGARTERGRERCADCDYDLQEQPRYACSERHDTYLDPGLCDCGRRLQPVGLPRGVHGQVVATITLGVGILVFLIAVWVVLALLG